MSSILLQIFVTIVGVAANPQIGRILSDVSKVVMDVQHSDLSPSLKNQVQHEAGEFMHYLETKAGEPPLERSAANEARAVAADLEKVLKDVHNSHDLSPKTKKAAQENIDHMQQDLEKLDAAGSAHKKDRLKKALGLRMKALSMQIDEDRKLENKAGGEDRVGADLERRDYQAKPTSEYGYLVTQSEERVELSLPDGDGTMDCVYGECLELSDSGKYCTRCCCGGVSCEKGRCPSTFEVKSRNRLIKEGAISEGTELINIGSAQLHNLKYGHPSCASATKKNNGECHQVKDDSKWKPPGVMATVYPGHTPETNADGDNIRG